MILECLVLFLTLWFLEVNARVSVKKVTSGFFRGKGISKFIIFEAIILKQKRKSVTKEFYIFVLTLKFSCLKQLQIFW